VNIPVGFVVLENCAALVLGPEKTDHAPVPLDGVFAPSVAAFPVQIVWSAPAAEVEGAAVNVIATSSLDAVHGAVGVIVHRKVYVPAPPAGVNVALFAVVLENCDATVPRPPTNSAFPTPDCSLPASPPSSNTGIGPVRRSRSSLGRLPRCSRRRCSPCTARSKSSTAARKFRRRLPA
jgi:hypothetical protein